MVKIISDSLELCYFNTSDTYSVDLIKLLEAEYRFNYFGYIEHLISHLYYGYIIYDNQSGESVGFITISTTDELAILIRKKWQGKGIATKALEILAKVDRGKYNYYIDYSNEPAKSLERKGIGMISRL